MHLGIWKIRDKSHPLLMALTRFESVLEVVVSWSLTTYSDKLFATIFRHSMVELLTQFSASNDENISFYGNKTSHKIELYIYHILYYQIQLLFNWYGACFKRYVCGPRRTKVQANGMLRSHSLLLFVVVHGAPRGRLRSTHACEAGDWRAGWRHQ